MKRWMIPTLFGLSLCSPGSAQTPGATEQEILKLEQTLDDAFLKKDRVTYERLLADDYLYIHSNGTMTNRMQEIAETMSADVKWTGSKFSNLRVRIYGDTAVVTGNQTLTGSARGYVSGPRLITDVWVKRNGRWQTIGGQTTLVPAR